MDSWKRVPWRDWKDWLSVYNLLSSDRSAALARLSQWQTRDSLPVLVDCTRLLLTTSQHTCGNCNFTGWEDTEVTRLLLGMAVLRVVNQVTDLHQKSRNAVPITAIAGTIDLPDYIVDVRHAATHGDLPDLFLLGKAVKDLYTFLLKAYWQTQFEALKEREKAVAQRLEKYVRKAKHTTDANTLTKCAAEAFRPSPELACLSEHLPQPAISAYSTLPEDSWVPLIAHLHTAVPGFSAACVQLALQLLDQSPEDIGKVAPMVEALVAVCAGVKVQVTREVKKLLTLANTQVEAFELVQFLREAEVFPEQAREGVKEIHEHALVSSTEVSGADSDLAVESLRRWSRVKYWSPKDIGSCSR